MDLIGKRLIVWLGLASFKNEKGDLQYWIAIEAKESKFGE